MLIDPNLAAVQTLSVSCQEQVDHCRSLAEYVASADVQQLFLQHADQLQPMVNDLERLLEQHNEMPRAVSEERETWDELISNVKAMLNADADRALVQDRLNANRAIIEQAEEALNIDNPQMQAASREEIDNNIDDITAIVYQHIKQLEAHL